MYCLRVRKQTISVKNNFPYHLLLVFISRHSHVGKTGVKFVVRRKMSFLDKKRRIKTIYRNKPAERYTLTYNKEMITSWKVKQTTFNLSTAYCVTSYNKQRSHHKASFTKHQHKSIWYYMNYAEHIQCICLQALVKLGLKIWHIILGNLFLFLLDKNLMQPNYVNCFFMSKISLKFKHSNTWFIQMDFYHQ